MGYYPDAGNGSGYLYLTDKDGMTIEMTEKNSLNGLSLFKLRAPELKPIMNRRNATGSIDVTNAAGAGLIVSITISGVNQLSVPVIVASVDETIVAGQIAAAINSFTPGSGLKHTAQAIGPRVNLYTPLISGGIPNNVTITVVTSGGNIVTTIPFHGGTAQPGSIDPIVGKRVFLNADYSGTADPNSLTNAVDITEDLLGDRGMVVRDKTITAGALNNIGRLGYFTTVNLDTEAAALTDKLAFIDTTGFQEGDLLLIRATLPGHVITIESANTTTEPIPVKNIYTTLDHEFITSGFNAIFLQFRYTDQQGGHFMEIVRSVGNPNYDVELSRADVTSLISLQSLQNGTRYLMYDVGDGEGLAIGNGGGIILQAVSKTKLDWQGTFLAKIVNRGLVSLFNPAVAASINAKRECINEAYNKIAAPNPGTLPCSDNTNWAFIPKSDTTYYLSEVHKCSYDHVNNIIKKRWDNYGAKLENTSGVANSNEIILSCYRWGLSTWKNNVVRYSQSTTGRVVRKPHDFVTFQVSTINANFFKNTLIDNTEFKDTAFTSVQVTGQITGNTFEQSTFSITNNFSSVNDNIFRNKCTIFVTTGNVINNNELSTSQVIGNTSSTIKWNKGCININGNASSKVLACNFADTNNVDDVGTPFSSISGNTSCDLQDVTFRMGTFDGNSRVSLTGGTIISGQMLNNITSATFTLNISGLYLNNSFFSENTITTNFTITNAILNNSVFIRHPMDINFTLATYGGVSGEIMQLKNLVLNNIHVDGENTSNLLNIVKDHLGYAPILGDFIQQYQFATDGIDQSNIIGVIDFSDGAVYAAGVITVPAGMGHVGNFLVINANPGDTITTINNLYPGAYPAIGNHYSNVNLEKRFYCVDGGAITANPTAFGSLSAGKFAAKSLTPITLTTPQDYFSVKRIGGVLHIVNSVELV